MKCLWLWLLHTGHVGFDAPPSLRQPLPAGPFMPVYSILSASSLLPPIQWYTLQEEGEMSGLTALEDKFNSNWWKWPKKDTVPLFLQWQRLSGLGGATLSCWSILQLKNLNVYWTCRALGENQKGKLIWTIIDTRSVSGGWERAGLWVVFGWSER